MKKCTIVFVILPLLLTVLLSGCTEKTSIKEIYQKVAVIDYVDRTITYDSDIYHYEYAHNKLILTYPNDTVCMLYNRDSFITIEWQSIAGHDNEVKAVYDQGYLHPNVIMYQVLEAPPSPMAPSKETNASPLRGILVVLIGGVIVFFPKAVWYIKSGWRYKDAEPSEVAIIVHRLSGVVAIVAGLVWMIT